MREHHQQMLNELSDLYEQTEGALSPEVVVEFARDSASALHARFEWDDTAAAHQHRLTQARKLLRVFVTVIHKKASPFRVFVSLPDDRKQPGGGYRLTVDVLSDQKLREQLLADAKRELQHFQTKYKILSKELAPVFSAIRRVMQRKRRRAAAS